jgi:hypothetical protein
LASRNLFSSPLDLRATNTHILADGTSHSSLEAVANLVQVHHGVSKDPVEVTDPLPRSETEQEASQFSHLESSNWFNSRCMFLHLRIIRARQASAHALDHNHGISLRPMAEALFLEVRRRLPHSNLIRRLYGQPWLEL